MDAQADAYRKKNEKYADELIAWKAVAKGILGAIRSKSEKNEPAEEDQKRLSEHNSGRPRKPKRFKLIQEKVTPLALIKNLSECHATTGIITDEAATVMAGRALADMGMLNKAHEGSTLSADTCEGSVEARDPCLTLALYVQPEIFDAFLEGRGELARAVGLLARCYTVKPPGAAGHRLLAYSVPASPEVLEPFYARCMEILGGHVDENSGELREKIELFFSADAQSRWEQEHDQIESLMNPGGFFYNDKDFASKHADRIARLAALLHFFEGADGPISLPTLERSIAISGWYAVEFVRSFAKPQQVPQEQLDANELLVWLANFVRTSGQFLIKKNDVRQNGPNPLRNKIRLNAALLLLWQNGIAWEAKNPDDKTTYVVLSQQYFTPSQVQYLCSQGAPIAG